MSPEQAFSANDVDKRADVFSLGVMIFELLAGCRPVGDREPSEIARAYLTGQVVQLSHRLPNVPPALAAAVHRAMAPLSKDRFADAGEFLKAIEPFTEAARGAPAPVKIPIPTTLPLVLYSYAAEGESFLQQLRSHLRPMVREGRIETWYAGKVRAGEDLDRVARAQIEEAKIILLLISASYFSCDRCYLEMQVARERWRAGVHVVPIIVRQCDWRHTSALQGLQPLPRDLDHAPIASRADRDEAWTQVSRELRSLLTARCEDGSATQ